MRSRHEGIRFLTDTQSELSIDFVCLNINCDLIGIVNKNLVLDLEKYYEKQMGYLLFISSHPYTKTQTCQEHNSLTL